MDKTIMKEYASARRPRKNVVRLDVDIGAELSGFGTAAEVTPAHRRAAKNYASPWLLGPPPSEELLELMLHMFTAEEAQVAQHLPPLRPRTAAQVAKRLGWPAADAERVLKNLADTKHVIMGNGKPRKYTILPIVPGTFELALITSDVTTRNSWHKKFAEIFERLFESGYLSSYVRGTRAPVRYLPVAGLGRTLHHAWPSDKMEEVLDQYDTFAVGNCQCRLAMRLVGKGCDRAMETCVSYGPVAEMTIGRGLMRRSDRMEIIEIKKAAEREGSVTWMGNAAGDPRGDVSCSCCGCCCHNLRVVSEFSAPGMISKPHYMPQLISENCKFCGACERICPMGAWDVGKDTIEFSKERCIGCGLCLTTCNLNALEFLPVADAPAPESGWFPLLMKAAPGYVVNSTKIWLQRLFSSSTGKPEITM